MEATLRDSTFLRNTSAASGGAIACFDVIGLVGAGTEITHCLFAENEAEIGGAIDNFNMSPQIIGCAFYGNSASLSGGAINNYLSSPTITSCSFGANWEGAGGQAISSSETSAPIITNCIIWNSDLPQPAPKNSVEIDPTSSATFSHSLIQAWTKSELDSASANSGNNLDPADPVFANSPSGNLRLLAGSPAIDAGDNTAVATIQDLGRALRVVNGTVDLGAYEFQGPAPTEGLFADLPCLSLEARASLLAHFDGRTGVATTEGTNTVESWVPVDGARHPLPAMAVTNMGTGAPGLITYDGSGTLNFDDQGSNERFLRGQLTNAAGSEMTVVWFGHYDAGNPAENSGAYAFNIGLNQISHQRDNFSGGFTVEMYNGTTYSGRVNIAPLDGFDTVWTTRVTANSHTAWAGNTDLDIAGSPTYNISANADIILGAFGPSGYDFVGEMQQLVIFESALGEGDRLLLQEYFEGGMQPIPLYPPTITPQEGGTFQVTWSGYNVVLQRSTDLIFWATISEAVSPMTFPAPSEGPLFFRLACIPSAE
ncbi:MAG: choice-of-anchor Q domain-containing protein [Verrucomicrobiales bacterium]